MREFESAQVLRTKAARTGCPEIHSGQHQNTELPRLLVGGAAVAVGCSKSVRKGVWTMMLLFLSMVAEPRAAPGYRGRHSGLKGL